MKIDPNEVASRFAYYPASTKDVAMNHDSVRQLCRAVALELVTTCPASRELSLALTNLEQVCMWANAAIARHQ